jgi:hypothetical protein
MVCRANLRAGLAPAHLARRSVADTPYRWTNPRARPTRKILFQAWELTSLEGLMFKAVDIQGGGALCGPYSRQPPYSSPKRSPTLRSSGALKEGRMEHSSASLQKPPATPCLKSTRRSQQVRAYKSSRGWNIQARRHRLTRQATQTVIFGADFKRAIKEASSRLRKKSIDRGKTGEG